MKVSFSGKGDEYFTHVVSTTSFADLRTIDTNGVPTTYKQRQAIRTLNYGPAVKVAIKFKTRWWEQGGRNQRGGSSYTDRRSRVVVYPSYVLGEDGPGVLMVTYNWCAGFPSPSHSADTHNAKLTVSHRHQDASRFGLATLYGLGMTVEYLRKETLDYHAFDWYHNPYTMGAFAHFAPGQFNTFFNDIVHPAGHGR
jgi:monoamine oxidase